MRPKAVWRAVLPVLSVVTVLFTGNEWASYVAGVVLALAAIASWRDLAVLEDGVLRRRGPLRWHTPVRLDEVDEIDLHYHLGAKDVPHLELRLYRGGKLASDLSLRWWSNWKPFLAVLVASLSADPESGDPNLRVRADERTLRRLESVLAGARPS